MIFASCTQQTITKNYGGTTNIELKPHEKLLGITWKTDDDLWVLTTDTLTGISYFRENSGWGIWQGQVIITKAK